MASKPFDLTIENREGYLYAGVRQGTGKASSNASLEYLTEVANECVRQKCSNVLIEKYTRETFRVWDVFLVAPAFTKLGHECVRMAVIEKGAAMPVKNTLNIMVGRYCGLDIRVFAGLVEGKAWLHVT